MTHAADMPDTPRPPRPLPPPERLWTVDEFATLWDRSPKTVRRWIREGKIHVVRLGGTVRIPNSEVLRLTSPDVDDEDAGEAQGGDELRTSPAVSRMLTGAAAS